MSQKKTFICYLHPEAGYRPELRSDTLWGLVCWGMRLLYGEKMLVDFLETYASDPELTISSAFPFKKYGAKPLLFFPLPLIPSYSPTESKDNYLEMYRLRKDVKNIRWVNQEDFEKVLDGSLTEAALWERAKKARQAEVSSLTVQELPEQKAPQIRTHAFTHNTIDRINLSTVSVDGSGQLFHIEERFVVDEFNESKDTKNTGLYFLVHTTEETMTKLAAIMRFYRFNGLGGDRSTGKGTFNFSFEPFAAFPTPANANMQVSLSLYHPTDGEISGYQTSADSHLMAYLLERRAGRVGFWTTNARKQPILYFKEGSVFPILDQPYFGHTPQSKVDQHQYYSYGHAFMVKMKI